MGSTPNKFQCSACRRRKPYIDAQGHVYGDSALLMKGLHTRVTLTGKVKHVGSHTGTSRNTLYKIQYKCNDCGHVGSSSHIHIYRKAVDAGLITPGPIDP